MRAAAARPSAASSPAELAGALAAAAGEPRLAARCMPGLFSGVLGDDTAAHASLAVGLSRLAHRSAARRRRPGAGAGPRAARRARLDLRRRCSGSRTAEISRAEIFHSSARVPGHRAARSRSSTTSSIGSPTASSPRPARRPSRTGGAPRGRGGARGAQAPRARRAARSTSSSGSLWINDERYVEHAPPREVARDAAGCSTGAGRTSGSTSTSSRRSRARAPDEVNVLFARREPAAQGPPRAGDGGLQPPGPRGARARSR